MQKRLNFLSAAAVGLVMAFPVAAQDTPTADTVVATVNGTDITLGHMIVARATLPEQYQQLPDDILFRGILDQLVQQTALSQTLDSELPARIALSLENERRSLMAGEAIEGVLVEITTEAAIQAAYDEKYSNVEQAEEYNASHILVETEEEALALKAQLDGGADFATLAKEKSTGPSGPQGGALGWFGSGMMVPAFEAAVIALAPGAVSDPVQTQFGWHVITLNETRKTSAPSLDEVREELTQEVQKAAVELHIDGVVEGAEVDRSASEAIDPTVLKQLDLVE
jgi:peptidyl-prolyl cis-trans isomerase C